MVETQGQFTKEKRPGEIQNCLFEKISAPGVDLFQLLGSDIQFTCSEFDIYKLPQSLWFGFQGFC